MSVETRKGHLEQHEIELILKHHAKGLGINDICDIVCRSRTSVRRAIVNAGLIPNPDRNSHSVRKAANLEKYKEEERIKRQKWLAESKPGIMPKKKQPDPPKRPEFIKSNPYLLI